MAKVFRIGTRDSQLAVWQATHVQNLLKKVGVDAELVYMKSEGDLDTITPLYALGVTGVFTKTLDAALLNHRIDLAVHSMKDVPTQLAQGTAQAAVLERASTKDILVFKDKEVLPALGYANGTWSEQVEHMPSDEPFIIGTGSIRRIAQWLNRYPYHRTENLRGNVNTRLRKLQEHNWKGAIFAAAGLERIELRPELSVDLDWMLPAPAQGAIMIACREEDREALQACESLNHPATALAVELERSFLSALMGGCSTPISALATVQGDEVTLEGNIVSPDGSRKAEVRKSVSIDKAHTLGADAAMEVLQHGGREIAESIRKTGFTQDD